MRGRASAWHAVVVPSRVQVRARVVLPVAAKAVLCVVLMGEWGFRERGEKGRATHGLAASTSSQNQVWLRVKVRLRG